MVSQFAQNEQNMNAVERILHYSELPSEGELHTPNDPAPSWPEKGAIRFEGVKMAYREGLPLVLKGINFDIRPGEKVRTISFRLFCTILTCYCRVS
jgi:ABC-type multidrug transport system fused ATPase/permease subunit